MAPRRWRPLQAMSKIVTDAQWDAARRELLAAEKALQSARDVSFAVISRGPLEKLLAYRDGASVGPEMPGLSVFTRSDEGKVLHTYSTYSRGLDPLNPVYQLLDLVPKGRAENALPHPMDWVRRHDEY